MRSSPPARCGPMYFIVKSDAFAAVYEPAAPATTSPPRRRRRRSSPQPKANLVVDGVAAPAPWKVATTVEVRTTFATRQRRRRRADEGGAPPRRRERRQRDARDRRRQRRDQAHAGAGASFAQTLTFTVPAIPAGDWRLEVVADRPGYVAESNESDNVAATTITIVSPDLVVADLATTGTLQGGETIRLTWTTRNAGTAPAANVRDAVYLSRDGAVGADDVKLGEVLHAALAAGASEASQLVVHAAGRARGRVAPDRRHRQRQRQQREHGRRDQQRRQPGDRRRARLLRRPRRHRGDRAAARHRRPGDGPRDVDGDQPRHRPRPHARLDRPRRLLDRRRHRRRRRHRPRQRRAHRRPGRRRQLHGQHRLPLRPRRSRARQRLRRHRRGEVVWENGQEANNPARRRSRST